MTLLAVALILWACALLTWARARRAEQGRRDRLNARLDALVRASAGSVTPPPPPARKRRG
jgi:hypothetical protein